MEFFGCEVPAGNPTTCSPGYGMYLHISQAALGDSMAKSKNGQERVIVKVQVDEGDEIVLGTLAEGKCDQMHLDLVFDRDFTISHNGKSSSVYICGYRTDAPEEFDDDEDEFEEEEEEEEEEKEDAPIPTAVQVQNNGAKAGKPAKSGKAGDAAKILSKVTDEAASTVANALAKAIQKTNAKKQVVEDDDSDEEDDSDEDEGMQHPFLSDLGSESDDDEFEAGDDSDEDMDEDEDEDDDDEDDEDESDESEEEELKTPEIKVGKKRSAAEPVQVSEKKAKTDAASKPASVNGKKGGKAAQVTPAAKDAAPKTPTDKGLKPTKTKGTPTAPPPTPVSVKKIGEHKCTGCDRAFTTESALSQHTAAKHK